MKLKTLFIIHSVITAAAGLVLIISPDLIPATVGIELQSGQHLLCYLLGASEIALAFLSWFAAGLTDEKSLRLICYTFILFHSVTAMAELLAYSQGLTPKIFANVVLRALIVFLFYMFGIRRNKI